MMVRGEKREAFWKKEGGIFMVSADLVEEMVGMGAFEAFCLPEILIMASLLQ